MSEITPELVEAMKVRDGRIRLIAEHIAVEQEIRDSATVNYILRQVTADADSAMEELAETSPLDAVSIAKLLVQIRTLVYIRRSLNHLKQRAGMAMHEVHLEDAALGDDDRDY